jgi:glutaminyl-tRNA synthetase
MSDPSSRLASIGISPTEISKTLKNKKLLERLLAIITASGCPDPVPSESSDLWKRRGPFLVKIAQKDLRHNAVIAASIGAGRITTPEQLDAAIEFVAAAQNAEVTVEALEAASGVGISVSETEVLTAIVNARQSPAIVAALASGKQPKSLIGPLVNAVKGESPVMRFASREMVVGLVKEELENPGSAAAKLAALGVAVATEVPVVEAVAAVAEVEAPVVEAQADADAELDFQGIVARFPSPADNAMGNSPEIQAATMAITGGRYMTRFPPEPNGWLHIGHAKAMFLDYGLAEEKDGRCYMRFDDTNPAKEKDEFLDGIEGDVRWMGFSWWKLTHTSDYFQQLYEFAVQLIKDGLAYVCHMTKAEVKASREKREPSPWRDRPPAESLREFELMKCGFYAPSEATLRLKMDYLSDNANMHDQVAYRVVYHPHPRTGDRWCIYPTYDYSHCVVDSLESISHSLCTLEFENRRQSYYWVLDALKIYKPFVWEFSRLNLTHTVMSKRRLQTLVLEHLVRGWDDPRMPTLAGLRRRGFTPSAIKAFVKGVGYTRNVKSTIDFGKLEYVQLQELDEDAPRAFCVLDPLPLRIVNWGEADPATAEGLLFPKKGRDGGVRELTIGPLLLIERDDFSEVPPKGFKRLTPGGIVGLKYANLVVRCVDVVKDGDRLIEVRVEKIDPAGFKAPAFIHWVSAESAVAEIRLYNHLFLADDPMAVPGDWRENLNPESLIIANGRIEKSLEKAKAGERFQFERLGFFVVDPDSSDGKLVFNRTVRLKSGFTGAK